MNYENHPNLTPQQRIDFEDANALANEANAAFDQRRFDAISLARHIISPNPEARFIETAKSAVTKGASDFDLYNQELRV